MGKIDLYQVSNNEFIKVHALNESCYIWPGAHLTNNFPSKVMKI